VINSENISGAQLDTLTALVERGPVDAGDIPSKSGRSDLIKEGFAVAVLVKGEQGFAAATYEGSRLYCECYGNSTTIAEATAYRIANREIGKIISK
jgi:hypothetical protein